MKRDLDKIIKLTSTLLKDDYNFSSLCEETNLSMRFVRSTLYWLESRAAVNLVREGRVMNIYPTQKLIELHKRWKFLE